MRVKAIIGAGVAAAILASAIVVSTGDANGTPADKPFASAGKSIKTGPSSDVPLLSATVHNSKTTDLILQVSMECSIITDNILMGSTVAGAEDSATTAGKVRAWITVDGVIVPIVSSSAPPQNPPAAGDETDKVTFCNRVFERTVKDTESSQDGYDYSRDYIETKDSNSFNWVRLNMGAGDHTIVLHGEFTENASAGSLAHAYIGNRSLVGIPGKFANDAVISDPTTP